MPTAVSSVANSASAGCPSPARSITPGIVWLDSAGKPINAHGGGVLFHQGIYYWYGCHKIEGLSEATDADGGVHAYASRDLVQWHDLGMMLPLAATGDQDLVHGCIFDRPKVVYNPTTQQFVLFFKFYPKGLGTRVGFVGVATSASPAGPFVYRHKFLGGNSPEGTGDFALFLDHDGALHHLAVRKPDKALVVGKMRPDFLLPEGAYAVVEGITPSTEAPAVIKHEGRFWMLGSDSTGWNPNAARCFSAEHITGPWTAHGNPTTGVNPHNGLGPSLTWGAQAASIFAVNGAHEAYVAIFDINKPEHPFESLHIWLPLTFAEGRMCIAWRDRWSPDIFRKAPSARS